MAKKETAASSAAETTSTKYDRGRWSLPGKRAKGYAEERKARVHKWGSKEGNELSDYESGMRSGYLQCQNDHSGAFKYNEARKAGFSKQEAGELSRKPWKEIKNTIAKKKKEKDND